MSGIIISDAAGLSAPLTKLIETVSAGVGKVYEPFHIKRMAKAKAEELKLISDAMLQTPELPVKYEDGKFLIDGTDFTEIAHRAQKRFVFQEIKKQQNIDSIIAQAATSLQDAPTVDNNPVDPDWISRFFDAAAHISSKDIQKLWGKILAGEISTGGSFSLRTLELLKNFSQADAILFNKIAPLVLKTGTTFFIPAKLEILKKQGIDYLDILQLNNSGMLNSRPMQNIKLRVRGNEYGLLVNRTAGIIISNASEREEHINVNCHFLTQAAKELYNITCFDSIPSYLNDVEHHLQVETNKSTNVSISQTLKINFSRHEQTI